MPAAPTYKPVVSSGDLAGRQQDQQSRGVIPPEAVALNTALQQTPAYQNYIASMQSPNVGVRTQAASALKAEGDRLGIPDNLILDPESGQLREKNWHEANSNWSGLIYTGAAIGIGLTAGAAAGAMAGGGAAIGAGGAGAGAGAATGVTAGGAAGATAAGGGLTSTIVNALINKGIPAAAQVLGGAAKGEQTQNNLQDQASLQQGNLALGRDKFALEAPNTRLATAIKASLASNFQPQHTEWAGPGSGLQGKVPKITGGLSAGLANLDPRVKELSNQVMMDELLGQQQGGPSGGKQDRAVPTINQSSGADKALGGLSLGTSILGALSPYFKGAKSSTGGANLGGIVQQAPSLGDDPMVHTGGLTEDEIYQMMQEGN